MGKIPLCPLWSIFLLLMIYSWSNLCFVCRPSSAHTLFSRIPSYLSAALTHPWPSSSCPPTQEWPPIICPMQSHGTMSTWSMPAPRWSQVVTPPKLPLRAGPARDLPHTHPAQRSGRERLSPHVGYLSRTPGNDTDNATMVHTGK